MVKSVLNIKHTAENICKIWGVGDVNVVIGVWYTIHTSTPILSTETKTKEKKASEIKTSIPIG